MPCRARDAELTVYIAEEGVQKLLNVYRMARPHEFKIVSYRDPDHPEPGYPDGHPGTEPIPLDNEGGEFHYAVRVRQLRIDMYPEDESLGSPVHPGPNQFQVFVEISFDFDDFDAPASFAFTEKVGALARVRLTERQQESGPEERHLCLIVDDVKLTHLRPDRLREAVEHVLLVLLRHAVADVRLPTTAGVADLVGFFVVDHPQIAENTTRIHAGLYF